MPSTEVEAEDGAVLLDLRAHARCFLSVGDGWVTFAAALGGALVGGLASTVGAVFVNRREVKRSVRIEIYRVLLMTLFDNLDEKARFPVVERQLFEIQNASTVAGRADMRQVLTLVEKLGPLREADIQFYSYSNPSVAPGGDA